MISVIIPTLNEEKLLARLLEQFTFDIKKRYRTEVIISDGGSVDNTLKIAKKFGAIVVTKRPDQQQTIAAGRNTGAWRARGDILVFIDADCLVQDVEYFLAKIKHEMRQSNLVAAATRIEIHPQERTWADIFWQGCFNVLYWVENKLVGMGRGNCQIIRASTFHKLDGYNEYLSAGEDYEMFRRLKQVGITKLFWDLVVYESPRRFRRYGYLGVMSMWFLNFISVVIRGRSWSEKWKRI